jgi:hypothetical protein
VSLYLLFLLYSIHKLWRAWNLTLAIRHGAFPVGISDTLQAPRLRMEPDLRTPFSARLVSPCGHFDEATHP